MITANKAIALKMLAHSRLSELMGGDEVEGGYTLSEEELEVERELDKLRDRLASENLTLKTLEEAPSSYMVGQISFYYKRAVDRLDRELKDGEVYFERVIGAGIINHLATKGFASNKSEMQDLINRIRGFGDKSHKETVLRMLIIAQRIIKEVADSSFIGYAKKARKERRKLK